MKILSKRLLFSLVSSSGIFWPMIAAQALEADPSRPNEDAMFSSPAPVAIEGKPATDSEAQSAKDLKDAKKGGAKQGNRWHEEVESHNASDASHTVADSHDDAKELGTSAPGRDAFASGEVTDNALQLGGIFYQRMIVSAQQGNGLSGAPVSLPLQFDGFMDARPSDRIRGYVDGRLFYDASRDANSNSTRPGAASSLQFSSSSAAPTSLSGTSATAQPSNPQVALDQAWLKFDIDRTVFVTAGKQHVKWGTSRFWNPTDLLSSQRRDPLLPYDLRLGNMMVKFELPLESQKTNFYAIALLDNPQPASSLGQIGAALRAERVFGSTEAGLDAIFRPGRAPVYGADLSSPLGPFDVYLEAACVSGAPSAQYQLAGTPVVGSEISSLLSTSSASGPFAQVSGGVNYSFGWRENRLATLGVEYFYNQLGSSSANVYPLLIFLGQYQPFYAGRNYAALYLTAEGPDSEKHTSYTFSTLGNLSDMSFISRLDFSWRVLTYLTFEAYVDGHYGNTGGEFNFALSTPPLTYQGASVPAVSVAQTYADLGLGLRLSF